MKTAQLLLRLVSIYRASVQSGVGVGKGGNQPSNVQYDRVKGIARILTGRVELIVALADVFCCKWMRLGCWTTYVRICCHRDSCCHQMNTYVSKSFKKRWYQWKKVYKYRAHSRVSLYVKLFYAEWVCKSKYLLYAAAALHASF